MLVYAFFIFNGVVFLFFGYDKWMAHGRGWRISERTLLLLALVGGSLGALVGMMFFRHKTRKASFQLPFIGILLVHIGIVVFVYMRGM